MRLDIGPSHFQCNLNIWDQLAPTKTIVLTATGLAEDSTKAFPKESTKDFVEESLNISLPNNQIHEPITRISKENKSKGLGSEP